MIRAEATLKAADNSGAISVECIHVNGSTGTSEASVGDIIVVTIKVCTSNGKVKKGDVCKAVVVRTKKPRIRSDGMSVSFDDNAVVIIDKNGEPLGTRILGPVAREVRSVCAKIVSLAEEVF